MATTTGPAARTNSTSKTAAKNKATQATKNSGTSAKTAGARTSTKKDAVTEKAATKPASPAKAAASAAKASPPKADKPEKPAPAAKPAKAANPATNESATKHRAKKAATKDPSGANGHVTKAAAKKAAPAKAEPVPAGPSTADAHPKDDEAPAARTATANSHAAPARGGLLSKKKEAPVRRTEGYTEERFLAHQRHALDSERTTYLEQAKSLKAEAESLVEEMEPGDIQFDDESGEGGTLTVDRERDLALSAQAMITVEEIDHALAKVDANTYGICENCGRLIPKARLEALPFARLCIDCKSGGLSRR